MTKGLEQSDPFPFKFIIPYQHEMATVTFWNNNDYDGMSDTFNGAQRRSYNTSQAWDSLKTGSNTWLIVWNGSNYTGDYLKIGPSTNNSDLNHTDRGSKGDWKNQITSFIMYGHQPSWWNSNSTPPTNDLNLESNEAVFCADTNFNGDTATFFANVSESDLNQIHYPTNSGRDMKDNIQSLATGSAAWLEIWNETSYTGSTLRIYPNTKYKDLNSVARKPEGDWKNQIQSFRLYNALPASWNLGFDQNKFYSSFPGAIKYTDSSGDYYHYTTQDCGYDIRLTGLAYDTSTMTVSFRVDYDLTGKNDKVLLDLVINANGTFNSVSYEYQQGGAVQIPKSVIKAVDVSAEILGAVGALETVGISEEAANSFIEAFDTFCEVFNKVSNGLYKLSESNDGRFYMVGVCVHVLCRAFSAVTGLPK